MGKSKKIKPIEYAERMLIAFAKESNQSLGLLAEPGYELDEWDLAAKADIIPKKTAERRRLAFYSGAIDDLPSIANLMVKKRWVISKKFDENSPRVLYPTFEGLRHAQWLMRPQHRKVWDYLKGDIRTAVISVIASLLTALLTYGILRLLGWL